ncbi:hypothetical protein TcasGA2_TC034714 [Tribolium castaneum]|uniref:Uncharacterized protein n=1 Tax=Tribolium castaneum TaxID=7070 RepID=A0A139WGU9_TRICA|nr:hypothetical protein TcasGA2_TC034714 [Tribolium castaneum]
MRPRSGMVHRIPDMSNVFGTIRKCVRISRFVHKIVP